MNTSEFLQINKYNNKRLRMKPMMLKYKKRWIQNCWKYERTLVLARTTIIAFLMFVLQTHSVQVQNKEPLCPHAHNSVTKLTDVVTNQMTGTNMALHHLSNWSNTSGICNIRSMPMSSTGCAPIPIWTHFILPIV